MNKVTKTKKIKKTFNENSEYFKWIEENKEKVSIISVNPTGNKIKVEYEEVK